MDSTLLSTRASLALASLTSQLSSLESQQSALLATLSVTSQNLQQLPAYLAIAPTLSQIPTYSAKLARLKRQMALQRQEVEALKRRALETGKRRRENLRRLRERERDEAERDRSVLRARIVGVDGAVTMPVVETIPVRNSNSSVVVSTSAGATPRVGTPTLEEERDDAEKSAGSGSVSGRGTPVQGIVKVVKKKKKARKAEIQ